VLCRPAQTGFDAEFEQVVLAVRLTITCSKQQILDPYAEVACHGHGFHGLEQASCGYLGHPAKDLTVIKGAVPAGPVNAPSVDDPGNARARLEHVIARMAAAGYLTTLQGQQVSGLPLGLTAGGNPSR
jgi:membrane peptidoglycan carboxypeptidase